MLARRRSSSNCESEARRAAQWLSEPTALHGEAGQLLTHSSLNTRACACVVNVVTWAKWWTRSQPSGATSRRWCTRTFISSVPPSRLHCAQEEHDDDRHTAGCLHNAITHQTCAHPVHFLRPVCVLFSSLPCVERVGSWRSGDLSSRLEHLLPRHARRHRRRRLHGSSAHSGCEARVVQDTRESGPLARGPARLRQQAGPAARAHHPPHARDGILHTATTRIVHDGSRDRRRTQPAEHQDTSVAHSELLRHHGRGPLRGPHTRATPTGEASWDAETDASCDTQATTLPSDCLPLRWCIVDLCCLVSVSCRASTG